MLQSLIRDSAVKLFALTARLGLDRTPGFSRVFLASYAIYKRYFEAGPIDRLKDFVPEGAWSSTSARMSASFHFALPDGWVRAAR